MQQGAKLRRRGRGEGAPGGGRGTARRGEGPAHAGGRGIGAPLPGKLRRAGGGGGARPARAAGERLESAGLRDTPGTARLPARGGRAATLTTGRTRG